MQFLNKIKNILLVLPSLILPIITFAAPIAPSGVVEIINSSKNLISNILLPIAFSLCLLYFFWGVVKYIYSEGTGKAEGRQIMMWGIVALFVAFCVWGIVDFLRSDLGISNIKVVSP